MACFAIFRSEQIVGTLDDGRAVIVLFAGSRHHPGAREEYEQQSHDARAANDRTSAESVALGPLSRWPSSPACACDQSSTPPHAPVEAIRVHPGGVPTVQRMSESSASKDAPYNFM
jgi:hypothetical protein